MEYEVAFEIAHSGIGSLIHVLPGVGFVVIGLVLIKNRKRLSENRPRQLVNVFLWFFLLFSLIWTLIAGFGVGLEQASLRSDYAAGHYKVVEGTVENFDPMPYEGHKDESFTVKGVKFSYSDFHVSPGFNNAASHGGPIKEGLHVRISYIGNTILKLEVAKSANN